MTSFLRDFLFERKQNLPFASVKPTKKTFKKRIMPCKEKESAIVVDQTPPLSTSPLNKPKSSGTFEKKENGKKVPRHAVLIESKNDAVYAGAFVDELNNTLIGPFTTKNGLTFYDLSDEKMKKKTPQEDYEIYCGPSLRTVWKPCTDGNMYWSSDAIPIRLGEYKDENKVHVLYLGEICDQFGTVYKRLNKLDDPFECYLEDGDKIEAYDSFEVLCKLM